jgi:hypothetical protein
LVVLSEAGGIWSGREGEGRVGRDFSLALAIPRRERCGGASFVGLGDEQTGLEDEEEEGHRQQRVDPSETHSRDCAELLLICGARLEWIGGLKMEKRNRLKAHSARPLRQRDWADSFLFRILERATWTNLFSR